MQSNLFSIAETSLNECFYNMQYHRFSKIIKRIFRDVDLWQWKLDCESLDGRRLLENELKLYPTYIFFAFFLFWLDATAAGALSFFCDNDVVFKKQSSPSCDVHKQPFLFYIWFLSII